MASALKKKFAELLADLTQKQRVYVEGRLRGLSKTAASAAAGQPNPSKNCTVIEKSERVQEALRLGRQAVAEEVLFDRKRAHDMLMDAHSNAANAIEQVAAIRELVKLHGVAAPEKKLIGVHHSGAVEHKEMQRMSDAELLQLAKLEGAQLPQLPAPEEAPIDAEYKDVTDDA